MTDKVRKIREEVERFQKRAEHNLDTSLTENERQFWLGESNVLTLIGKYIDTMQGEQIDYGKLQTSLDDALSKETKESWDKFLQEEPVSEDFEATLAKEWQGYVDRGAATVDALEDNTQELAFAKGFYRGWHYPKVSVWHDTTDMPDKEKKILVVGFNGEAYAGYYNGVCSPKKINHWSYIDELLKL